MNSETTVKDLSPEEKRILRVYRSLNDYGREYFMRTIEAIDGYQPFTFKLELVQNKPAPSDHSYRENGKLWQCGAYKCTEF